MALHDLLSAMRAEADEEIARLERDSRDEAARILAGAEREARALEDERLGHARAELDAELARRRALAGLDAARVLDRGREELFGELLDELRERVAALRGSEGYRALFAELLRESVTELPTGRHLRVDPRDAALARELAAELTRRLNTRELDLRPELETMGGVELETEDRRRLCNTLEARLAAAEPELRMCFGRLAAALLQPSAAAPRNRKAA